MRYLIDWVDSLIVNHYTEYYDSYYIEYYESYYAVIVLL